jgi:transcriptional regulator with XRE-family HTH domain
MADKGDRTDPAKVARFVAQHVRALRATRGWTLDELARRSHMSKGMVVQIERGGTNPSIVTLCRLADGLGVTVSRLIEDDVVPEEPVMRLETPATLWHGKSGSTAQLISGFDGSLLCELWDWQLAANDAYTGHPHPAGTLETLHILDGTLVVQLKDSHQSARRGETLVLRADRPHRYVNESTRPVRFTMMLVEPRPNATLQRPVRSMVMKGVRARRIRGG